MSKAAKLVSKSKIWKPCPCKTRYFLGVSIHDVKATIFGSKAVIFPARNTTVYIG